MKHVSSVSSFLINFTELICHSYKLQCTGNNHLSLISHLPQLQVTDMKTDIMEKCLYKNKMNT